MKLQLMLNTMLNEHKNKLLSLLSQFKTSFYEAQHDIDNKTNELGTKGKFSEASSHSFIFETIERNITSIEKNVKKI